jgi:hypothetical protein
MLGGCAIWPTGQDPYGMEQRREANVVMTAVQTYDHATGHLPQNLNALVPTYLAALPSRPELQYDPRNGSMSYQYHGSWPQIQIIYCQSEGNTTIWRCNESKQHPT